MLGAAQDEAAQAQQQVLMLESVVRQKLTREALERYGNFKTAHPEKAMQLVMILAQAIQQQGIESIDDQQLKELLKRMNPKREIKITRK